MSPPARPPSFFNSLSGVDTPYPDSLREPGFLLDDLAADVRLWPEWLLDDDSQRTITLSVVEHVREHRLVVAFAVDRVSGTITAAPDPSGFLRVVVAANGFDVVVGYIERIWEEHEIWPPGAVADYAEEAPGRLGKHRSWVSISARGWPALTAIANENGWLNLRQVETPPTDGNDT